MDCNWPQEELTVSGRVGIGTDAPSEELDVIGNISATGKVVIGKKDTSQIGTETPSKRLEVIGDISATNLTLSGSANAAQFVGDGSNLTGLVTTTGNSTIDGSLTINQNLAVGGNFQLGTLSINAFSSDGNLADNSNLAVPTQQAVITYVDSQITQVNNALDTKANLNGATDQNFATNDLSVDGNLQVLGNLEVQGDVIARDTEHIEGNVSLGDEDSDLITIAGVVNSAHSSGALEVNSGLHTTGSVSVDGSLSVNNAIATNKINATGTIQANQLHLPTAGTQIFHNTNASGTPNGDGFRLRYDNNFFGTNADALVIEKTDGHHTPPDGGIAFVNTGNDGVVETALAIKGNGNVGIGTTSPVAKLNIVHQSQDANGNTLILGVTNASNLRLGYHTEYSWIQSHGSKPLAINPLGNNVGIGIATPNVPLHIESKKADQGLKIGAKDKNTKIYLHIADGDYGFLGLGGETKLRGNGQSSTFSGNLQIVRDQWAYLDIRCSKAGEDAVIRLFDGEKGSDSEHYWSIHNDDSAGNQLNIRSNNESKMTIKANGSIGIGTTSPASGAKLDVRGNLYVGGQAAIASNNYWHRAQSTGDNRYGYFEVRRKNNRRGLYLGYGSPGKYVDLRLEEGNALAITGGKVGIGTKTPKSTQHIVGDLVLGKDVNNQKFIFHSRTNGNGDFLHITCDNSSGGWDWSKGIMFFRDGDVRIRGNIGGFTGNDQDEWPKITWYRDIPNNWDEGLIKHSSNRGFFGRAGYGIHIHHSRDWGIWSSGWTPLLGVQGGTGNLRIRGTLQQGCSREFKENINNLTTEDAIQTLEGLNPIKFNYKADERKETHLGFIAEEVPELVASHDRQGLSPMDIVAILTKVVKEQHNTISVLREKVETLEQRR